MPATDIAAALAVLLQDDQPLLLEPEPEPVRRPEGTRGKKAGGRQGGPADGATRQRAPRRGQSDVPMATYRIEVGKRHKVEPRQIVGAIANEGGLNRADFGHIDIRPDHSLVELPADLPADSYAALERTRISGQLIGLRLAGPGAGSSRPARKHRS